MNLKFKVIFCPYLHSEYIRCMGPLQSKINEQIRAKNNPMLFKRITFKLYTLGRWAPVVRKVKGLG